MQFRQHRPSRLRPVDADEELVGDVEIAESALDHDRVTTRYLDRVFGVRWEDPMLYHVQLNTSALSVEQAAQIIAHAARVACPPS